MNERLLTIENLAVDYVTSRGTLSAVSGVSMELYQNEICAMVGNLVAENRLCLAPS